MKSSINYHADLERNILRQIVFTDKNLAVGSIVAINLSLVLLKGIDQGARVVIHTFLTCLVLFLLSLKVEGRLLIYMLPRMIIYWLSPKKLR